MKGRVIFWSTWQSGLGTEANVKGKEEMAEYSGVQKVSWDSKDTEELRQQESDRVRRPGKERWQGWSPCEGRGDLSQ